MNKNYKLIIAIITIGFINFILGATSSAVETKDLRSPVKKGISTVAPKDTKLLPDKISLPAEFGYVIDKNASTSNNPLLVVHIQDLHCNYEAQKNISNIIENLHKNYGVDLVLLEGGSGEYDLTPFSSFKTKKYVVNTTEHFMKKGRITGPESLKITQPELPLRLIGIEDRNLYLKHLENFRGTQVDKTKLAGWINVVSSQLDQLKEKIYSKELLDLDRKINEYDANKLGLNEFISYLRTEVDRYKIDIAKAELSNVRNLLNLVSAEKGINFKVADSERETLINELSKKLDKEKLKEVLVQSVDLKEGKINQEAYYTYLKNLYGKDFDAKFVNLSRYLDYLKISNSIDHSQLTQELDILTDLLKDKLMGNPDQIALNKLSKDIKTIKDLINISLSRRDLEYYKENKGQFTSLAFEDFIEKNKGYLTSPASIPAIKIETLLRSQDEFYTLAIERDIALTENILKLSKLNLSKNNAVVFVGGGFHTKAITNFLKDKDISYVVISPKVAGQINLDLYKKVLLNPTPSISELLKVDYILPGEQVGDPTSASRGPIVAAGALDNLGQAIKDGADPQKEFEPNEEIDLSKKADGFTVTTPDTAIDADEDGNVRGTTPNDFTAIGKGSSFEALKVKLPSRINIEDVPEGLRAKFFNARDSVIQTLQNARVRALELGLTEEEIKNIDIAIQNISTLEPYFCNAEIKGPEDYRFHFTNPNYVGVSVELLEILPQQMLEKTLFHEFYSRGPKEGSYTAHQDIITGIERRVYGEQLESQLKLVLRGYINGDLMGLMSAYGKIYGVERNLTILENANIKDVLSKVGSDRLLLVKVAQLLCLGQAELFITCPVDQRNDLLALLKRVNIEELDRTNWNVVASLQPQILNVLKNIYILEGKRVVITRERGIVVIRELDDAFLRRLWPLVMAWQEQPSTMLPVEIQNLIPDLISIDQLLTEYKSPTLPFIKEGKIELQVPLNNLRDTMRPLVTPVNVEGKPVLILPLSNLENMRAPSFEKMEPGRRIPSLWRFLLTQMPNLRSSIKIETTTPTPTSVYIVPNIVPNEPPLLFVLPPGLPENEVLAVVNNPYKALLPGSNVAASSRITFSNVNNIGQGLNVGENAGLAISGNVILGNNVKIGEGAKLEVISQTAKVLIGNNVAIQPGVTVRLVVPEGVTGTVVINPNSIFVTNVNEEIALAKGQTITFEEGMPISVLLATENGVNEVLSNYIFYGITANQMAANIESYLKSITPQQPVYGNAALALTQISELNKVVEWVNINTANIQAITSIIGRQEGLIRNPAIANLLNYLRNKPEIFSLLWPRLYESVVLQPASIYIPGIKLVYNSVEQIAKLETVEQKIEAIQSILGLAGFNPFMANEISPILAEEFLRYSRTDLAAAIRYYLANNQPQAIIELYNISPNPVKENIINELRGLLLVKEPALRELAMNVLAKIILPRVFEGEGPGAPTNVYEALNQNKITPELIKARPAETQPTILAVIESVARTTGTGELSEAANKANEIINAPQFKAEVARLEKPITPEEAKELTQKNLTNVEEVILPVQSLVVVNLYEEAESDVQESIINSIRPLLYSEESNLREMAVNVLGKILLPDIVGTPEIPTIYEALAKEGYVTPESFKKELGNLKTELDRQNALDIMRSIARETRKEKEAAVAKANEIIDAPQFKAEVAKLSEPVVGEEALKLATANAKAIIGSTAEGQPYSQELSKAINEFKQGLPQIGESCIGIPARFILATPFPFARLTELKEGVVKVVLSETIEEKEQMDRILEALGVEGVESIGPVELDRKNLPLENVETVKLIVKYILNKHPEIKKIGLIMNSTLEEDVKNLQANLKRLQENEALMNILTVLIPQTPSEGEILSANRVLIELIENIKNGKFIIDVLPPIRLAKQIYESYKEKYKEYLKVIQNL